MHFTISKAIRNCSHKYAIGTKSKNTKR